MSTKGSRARTTKILEKRHCTKAQINFFKTETGLLGTHEGLDMEEEHAYDAVSGLVQLEEVDKSVLLDALTQTNH